MANAGIRPFLPINIAGLILWLKADDLSLSDADPVETWADASGSANDVAQSTASWQPIYKINIQNGLPVVRFDGVDNVLWSAAFGTPYAQPNTMFIAANIIALTGNSQALIGDVITGGANIIYVEGNTDDWTLYAGNNGLSGDNAVTGWHAMTGIFNGAASGIWQDGTDLGTVSPGAGAFSRAMLGGSNSISSPSLFVQIDIGEVIVYHALLTSAERANVEAYLKARWATP